MSVFVAPDRRRFRIAVLVVRAERAADEQLRALADEAVDDAVVALGQAQGGGAWRSRCRPGRRANRPACRRGRR
jgi:hypothetical protein